MGVPVEFFSIDDSKNMRCAKPGHARGERHPKALLTDADCELIRELYGDGGHLTYAQLAEKFECAKSTVRDIIKCRTRYARTSKWLA